MIVKGENAQSGAKPALCPRFPLNGPFRPGSRSDPSGKGRGNQQTAGRPPGGVPERPCSEREVPRHQAVQAVKLDLEILHAVAIDIRLDDGGGAGLDIAQFAGRA